MEQITIIGLLIIIVLILLDKKFLIKVPEKNRDYRKTNLPSIMGGTKPIERQALPTDTAERQNRSALAETYNFESETGEKVFYDVQKRIDLDEILVADDEWEQEDEDWKYQHSTIESGFATGVTFQELSTAGQLLQEDVLEPDLEQQAVDIIQKVQGTELFDLLENSLGNASKRIAKLLSQRIQNAGESTASNSKDGVEGFDIGEFV